MCVYETEYNHPARIKTLLDLFITYRMCLLQQKLIVKPDQLIKRRGKLGLIKVGTDFSGVKQWLSEHMLKEIAVGQATGILKNFIIEPFVTHKQV